MNAYYFFKRFIRINIRLINKVHLPKAYVCDPMTYLGLRRKHDIYNSLSHYLKHSNSMFNFGLNSKEYSEERISLLPLLSIPLSFFILEMFKPKLHCEEEIAKEEKPYLGCSIRLKPNEGMQIVLVKSDSPAERAGLKVKDVILEVESKPTKSINEFFAAVGREKGRKKIKVKTELNEIKEIYVVFE